MRVALSIAGFDPSSGAGITADLAVMAAHDYFGLSTITALTVQSTLGVAAVHPVDPVILAQSLDHLLADTRPTGVKIGMLANAANVRVVANFLRKLQASGPPVTVVLDPVIRSSSGRELLDRAGIQALREELFPLVSWVTPNQPELATLTNMDVAGPASVEAAARKLASQIPSLSIITTGGDQNATDFFLLPDGSAHWLEGEKITSRATHGTGCAFSTALLCHVADGALGIIAAQSAKAYITEAIRRAHPVGQGNGPLNLLWPLEHSAQNISPSL